MLSTDAGLHEPVIPFDEVAGKTGTDAPAHMVAEVPKLKVGVTEGVTVTVNVAGLVH